MASKVRIKMNPGYASTLAREAAIKADLRAKAEKAAAIAKSTAPVATGAYRDSIEVDDQGRLVSTDPMAHLIEWGSRNNRAHATLRNAADEVATRLVED